MDTIRTDFNTQAGLPFMLLVLLLFWLAVSDDAKEAETRLTTRRRQAQPKARPPQPAPVPARRFG